MAKTQAINTEQVCEHCGTNYVPAKRNKQKYCSNSCRTIACRDRKVKKPLSGIENKALQRLTNVEMSNELGGRMNVLDSKLTKVEAAIHCLNITLKDVLYALRNKPNNSLPQKGNLL